MAELNKLGLKLAELNEAHELELDARHTRQRLEKHIQRRLNSKLPEAKMTAVERMQILDMIERLADLEITFMDRVTQVKREIIEKWGANPVIPTRRDPVFV